MALTGALPADAVSTTAVTNSTLLAIATLLLLLLYWFGRCSAGTYCTDHVHVLLPAPVRRDAVIGGDGNKTAPSGRADSDIHDCLDDACSVVHVLLPTESAGQYNGDGDGDGDDDDDDDRKCGDTHVNNRTAGDRRAHTDAADSATRVACAPAEATHMLCTAPASGAALGYVPRMNAADVRVRVRAARAAQQRAWRHTSFDERRRVMREMRRYIARHQREIIAASALDTGKTHIDAVLGEILTTLEKLRWIGERGAPAIVRALLALLPAAIVGNCGGSGCGAGGEGALASEHRAVGPLTVHKRARIDYVPLGVIGAIAPWNYPFHNMYNPLIAALFAGNAVVIKCSEYSAWSSVYFARVARAVLVACGHSPALVQLVTGDGEAGAALVADAGVDKVFFTGSTAVGRVVARTAAASLKPAVLELGGKDALVVCDDADFEQAVQITLRGVFQNAGQNCVGVERVFVQRDVYERFVARMVREVQRLRRGEDLGVMTMGAPAVARVRALVADAVQRGGRVRVGHGGDCGGGVDGIGDDSEDDTGNAGKTDDDGSAGARQAGDTDARAPPAYCPPCVLTDVPHDARIYHEEVFGPVMLIAPFTTDADALALVNHSEFGLGSSVFTLDPARGERLARGIRAGMTNINDFGVNYLCQSMPFGGTKSSGSDRFAGVEGLRGCCLAKSVTVDRWQWMRTRIPPTLHYPMEVRRVAAPFADALVRLVYDDAAGGAVVGRCRAALDLIRSAMRGGGGISGSETSGDHAGAGVDGDTKSGAAGVSGPSRAP